MPAFGLLKEEVLASLEEQYTKDKQLFQEDLNKLIKSLKKSKVLSELFQQYDSIFKIHFDDIEDAKEYLAETVDYLKSLQITPDDLKLLEGLNRLKIDQNKNIYVEALDKLVFSNRKDIKSRVESKRLLTQKLITENKIQGNIDPKLRGVFLEILQKKIKNRVSNLTEQEISAINAFAEKDQEKLLSNYISLVDDNVSAINEQLNSEQSEEIKSRLQQAKESLLEMKKEAPTLNNLERLLVLREGFTR
jgi:uncharacterized protein YfeS